MNRTEFVIITGASGTGKSTALKTLEDIGYYAVDNLPADLVHDFAHLVEKGHADIRRAAMVMDIRERDLHKRFPDVVRSMKESGYLVNVVCLEADRDVLQKRFSETRRVHPLDPTIPLKEALAKEAELLRPLCGVADVHIDTSEMTLHDLRRHIRKRFSVLEPRGRLLLSFVSFGYKYGLPSEADLVFDVRFLPNPFFHQSLKDLNGMNPDVQRFVEGSGAYAQFMMNLESFLADLLPRYADEGRGYLTVAVGCTGGMHRSVVVVERLSRTFGTSDIANIQVRHRELFEE
ncbi:MAG: RNase adapter RapZ [bacterium]|nr:MAG: RNase adapter RapZ [bacterium]